MATYEEHNETVTEADNLVGTRLNVKTTCNAASLTTTGAAFFATANFAGNGIGQYTFSTTAGTTLTAGGPWTTLPVAITPFLERTMASTSTTILPIVPGIYGTNIAANVSVAENVTPFFEIGISINGADPLRPISVSPLNFSDSTACFTFSYQTIPFGATLTYQARLLSTFSGAGTATISIAFGSSSVVLFGLF